MTKLNLVQWCDEQVAQGKELKILWDGGGDSGWASFEIDGNPVESDVTELILNYCYDTLDYGSWAGEFQASGEATYNSETKCFEGVDDYCQDSQSTHYYNINIKIPKQLWFETLDIRLDDEGCECGFSIKNGFITEEHTSVINHLTVKLDIACMAAIDEFSKDYDFSRLWETYSIDRSEFEESEDGMLSFDIDSIEMTYKDCTEKQIVLNIEELEDKLN